MKKLKANPCASLFIEEAKGHVKPFPGFKPAVFVAQMRGRELTPGHIRSALKWMLDQAYFPRYPAYDITYIYTAKGNVNAVWFDLGEQTIVVPVRVGPDGRIQ